MTATTKASQTIFDKSTLLKNNHVKVVVLSKKCCGFFAILLHLLEDREENSKSANQRLPYSKSYLYSEVLSGLHSTPDSI